MAIIRVNHKQLETTAQAIEDYVREHKKKMSQIDTDVTGMKSAWSGKDYDQFLVEWTELSGGGSISDKMIKALENYAEFLRYAEKKYKDAQIDAVNRSRRLW